MPYKSDKIIISGTSYDRRRKLSEDRKELIRRLSKEEKLSQRKLADMFGVSRRLITFILFPEKEAHAKELFKQRKKSGKYKLTKEHWAQVVREHRRYKQQLYVEGKISE